MEQQKIPNEIRSAPRQNAMNEDGLCAVIADRVSYRSLHVSAVTSAGQRGLRAAAAARRPRPRRTVPAAIRRRRLSRDRAPTAGWAGAPDDAAFAGGEYQRHRR